MPVSNVMETLTSGMISNQERQDIISNNLANVNTRGYKKDITVQRSFNKIFENTQRSMKARNLHDSIYYTSSEFYIPSFTHEVKTNFEQGGLEETNNSLDCAISGNGFFTIQTEDGPKYTRNGSFMLNENNELITSHGYRVLSENTESGEDVPIVINGKNITLLSDGTIQADGINVGKMQIVEFDNYDLLKKSEKSLYEYQGNKSDIHNAGDPKIEQGYVERSNVNAINEMTDILQNSKQYELAGKSFKAVEQTLSRAITELGKFK